MDACFSSAELSRLIGLIYDCAIDPTRWPIAMDAMRLAMDFEVSTLNLQRLPSFEVVVNVTANIEPRFAAMIDRAGSDVVEQWGGEERLLSLPTDRPHVLSWVNPSFDSATTTNRYFQEFARPQRLIDVLAVSLARDDRGLGSLAFGRHERAGPIGDREVAAMALLLPHVQRAATINRLLDEAGVARRSFAAVIDLLSIPTLLVGSGCEIVHANPVAARLLDAGELVRRRHGRLEAEQPGITRALAAAAASLAENEAKIGRRGLDIPIQDFAGATGAIHMLPLGQRLAGRYGHAVAAVFIADIRGRFVPPADLATALFDLTPAEARTFDMLAAGHRVAEAAVALNVAPSTVKTHMLRLYDKMGVNRRSELVRLAAALAMPLATQ